MEQTPQTREAYEALEMEVIQFEADDVIVTSGGEGGGMGGGF